jgi:predicted glycosyltransferase
MQNIYLISQHNLGVGHLNRTSNIAHSLLKIKGSKVWQITCGPEVKIISRDRRIKFVQLPALVQDNLGSTKLVSFDKSKTIDEVSSERVRALKNLFKKNKPDVFITEFFPFAPHRLYDTIVPVLKEIKNNYPACSIVCSSRDIPVCHLEEVDSKKVNEVERIFNEFYDLLLIHSDKDICSIEGLSAYSKLKISCPIKYTGYVCMQKSANQSDFVKGDVLVTVGGGRDGFDIINTAIGSAKLMPKLDFVMVCGPFMNDTNFNELAKSASGLKNVKLYRYIKDLRNNLNNFRLVVCAGGYNTIIESLNVRVRIISIPRKGSYEQINRVKYFAKKNLLKIISESSLSEKELVKQISFSLKDNVHSASINFSGMENTLKLIMEQIEKKECFDIYFHVSDVCNMHCPKCHWFSENINVQNKIKAEDLGNFLKREIKKGTKIGKVLFSGGEPSLWQDFGKSINLIPKEIKDVRVFTNGSFPDAFRMIKRNICMRISIHNNVNWDAIKDSIKLAKSKGWEIRFVGYEGAIEGVKYPSWFKFPVTVKKEQISSSKELLKGLLGKKIDCTPQKIYFGTDGRAYFCEKGLRTKAGCYAEDFSLWKGSIKRRAKRCIVDKSCIANIINEQDYRVVD